MHGERASRTHHPSARRRNARSLTRTRRVEIPDEPSATLELAGRKVSLTNLDKVFFPEPGLTKRDLLQHYADVAPVLLPHLQDRAMVMLRHPNGVTGPHFYMKRAPKPHPDWLDLCCIKHGSGNIIDFPVVQDLATLLWLVNLGCIDLHPWYARCDDVDKPDFLHFDLDPGPAATWTMVRESALALKEALDSLTMSAFVKTTGSRGLHVYVPIVRGPNQKEVWTVAKTFAIVMAQRQPGLMTSEYRKANRPRNRVLVDYNQNAWGRTLASVYSVRPRPMATVSMPVTWDEVRRGVEIADFRMDNARERIEQMGDPWKPLLQAKGRFNLQDLR